MMPRGIRIRLNCLIFAIGLWLSKNMKSSLFITRSTGLKGLIPHFGHINYRDKFVIIEDYIPRKRKTNLVEKGDSFVLFDGIYRTRIYQLVSSATSDSLYSARKEAIMRKGEIWGDSTVTLKSSDLPGTVQGTVTLPAFR